jgi:hypothetical protein
MSREAMQMALEALELYQSKSSVQMFDDAVKALRQALETEQEPVAWMYEWDSRKHLTFTDQRFVEQAHPHFNKSTPLYTAPLKKQWVGLTDEEHDSIKRNYHDMTWTLEMFARAIEQALKEKNT